MHLAEKIGNTQGLATQIREKAMTGKIAKVYIGICVCVSMAAILALLFCSGNTNGQVSQTAQQMSETQPGQESAPEQKESQNEVFVHADTLPEGSISLRLPDTIDAQQVQITSDDMKKQIQIALPKEAQSLTGTYFAGHPLEENAKVLDAAVTETKHTVSVVLTLPTVYAWEEEYTADSDGMLLTLHLVRPKDKYGKVIVLDAGHGGEDSGICAGLPDEEEEELAEKDIALAIVLAAGERLTEQGIYVYYTRKEDVNPTAKERVALANDTSADLLVSIHADSDEDTSLYGMRTVYNSTYFIPDFGSADLAYLLLEKVAAKTNEKAIGLEADNGQIYLLQNAMMPVSQLNVGYLSNRQEQKLLRKQDYIQKIADGVADCVLASYEEMKQ